MTYDDKRNMLIDYSVCTEDELELVEYINGSSDGTIDDILYVREGFYSFDEWFQEVNHE